MSFWQWQFVDNLLHLHLLWIAPSLLKAEKKEPLQMSCHHPPAKPIEDTAADSHFALLCYSL